MLVDILQVFLFSSRMTMGIGALKRAITEHLGSQAAAAKIAGVTPQAVSEILRRGRRVPAEWCLAIEQATGGAVTRHELRPDLYPKEGPGVIHTNTTMTGPAR